jgi:hypothetical protein
MAKIYRCMVSDKPIPEERVEALKMLGIPEDRWTCVEHAVQTPKKGIYLGEAGTSQLLIVDKVYDDSVRSVFRGGKRDTSENKEDEEEESPAYNAKELNYYLSNDEPVEPEEKI